MPISFNVPRETALRVNAVVHKAVTWGLLKKSQVLDYHTSVSAYIAQGGALNLDKLEAADKFTLAHDLLGIHRHIDKDDNSPTAGQLLNHFLPRCTH